MMVMTTYEYWKKFERECAAQGRWKEAEYALMMLNLCQSGQEHVAAASARAHGRTQGNPAHTHSDFITGHVSTATEHGWCMGVGLIQGDGGARIDTTAKQQLLDAEMLKSDTKFFLSKAQKAQIAGVNDEIAAQEGQWDAWAVKNGTVVTQAQVEKDILAKEEELLAELLAKRGMVSVDKDWHNAAVAAVEERERAVPELTPEQKALYEGIGDPKNAHLFSAEAAHKDFVTDPIARNLGKVSEYGGVRMGMHAWQAED